MSNGQQYKDTRAAILAVVLARVGCVAFGAYYLVKLDAYGVGLMATMFWGMGFLLPITRK